MKKIERKSLIFYFTNKNNHLQLVGPTTPRASSAGTATIKRRRWREGERTKFPKFPVNPPSEANEPILLSSSARNSAAPRRAATRREAMAARARLRLVLPPLAALLLYAHLAVAVARPRWEEEGSNLRLPSERGVAAAMADDTAEAAEGTRWAVLIAGSNGYYNYRHQVTFARPQPLENHAPRRARRHVWFGLVWFGLILRVRALFVGLV